MYFFIWYFDITVQGGQIKAPTFWHWFSQKLFYESTPFVFATKNASCKSLNPEFEHHYFHCSCAKSNFPKSTWLDHMTTVGYLKFQWNCIRCGFWSLIKMVEYSFSGFMFLKDSFLNTTTNDVNSSNSFCENNVKMWELLLDHPVFCPTLKNSKLVVLCRILAADQVGYFFNVF
jgi:hypothetical protein